MEENNCISWGEEDAIWSKREEVWSFCVYVEIDVEDGYNLAIPIHEIPSIIQKKSKKYIKLIVFVSEEKITQTKEKTGLKIKRIQQVDITSSDKKIAIKVD